MNITPELSTLLGPPRRSHWRIDWDRLTAGDGLFSALSRAAESTGGFTPRRSWFICPEFSEQDLQAIQTGADLSGLIWFLKRYYVNREEQAARSDAQARWEVLGRMLWCFERSGMGRPGGREGLARLTAELRLHLPQFTADGVVPHSNEQTPGEKRSSEEAWAYMCVRRFWGAAPERQTTVPVGLWRNSGDDSGFLATLQLDLIPDGIGRLSSAPAVAFETTFHDAFEGSMLRAWKAAFDLIGGPDTAAPLYDGSWRLRPGAPFAASSDRSPLSSIDGESASGAAARGWWYALSNKIPDPEIVVLARVTPELSLAQVEGIRAKVRAVVRDSRLSKGHDAFDTIVVHSNNAQEARDALGDGAGSIRIVPLG